MGKIFISYRRAESEYVVGRIYDELCKTYGRENVFKDIESIPLGLDFRKEISKVVHSCNILLAIIGENWETIKDDHGNIRIHDDNDYVKIEIEEALKRNIPVIPILTNNAQLPSEKLLPDTIKELSYRNAISIRPDPDFNNDIKKLKDSISKIYKKPINKKFYKFALVGAIAVVLVAAISLIIEHWTKPQVNNIDEQTRISKPIVSSNTIVARQSRSPDSQELINTEKPGNCIISISEQEIQLLILDQLTESDSDVVAESWYKFIPNRAGNYTINVLSNIGGDPVLKIFGPDNNKIKFGQDDDSGEGKNPKFSSIFETKSYYICVSHYDKPTPFKIRVHAEK